MYGGSGNVTITNRVSGENGGETYYTGLHVVIDRSNGNDYIESYGYNNSIDRSKGNDYILNANHYSTVNGGVGNDTIEYKSGKVTINGGKGNDSVSNAGRYTTITASKGNVKINNSGGSVTINGANANVSISNYGKISTLTGREGHDTILLGTALARSRPARYEIGGDIVLIYYSSGKGDVTIDGGKGIDILFGGKGDDKLIGGKGNVSLSGYTGNDSLWGGKGDDVFAYRPNEGTDTITDFQSGDMLKILNADGSNGTFTKAAYASNKLTLTISGGGSVIFTNVGKGDNININGTSYTISGKTLK